MIKSFVTKQAEPFNAPPKTKRRDIKKDKRKKQLGPNQIGPVEWEDTNENGTQTMVTSLPATFVPAPGGYQGRIAQQPERSWEEPQKLVIGIDIDGVIADFQPVLMGLASEYVPISEEDKHIYKVKDTEHGDADLEHKVREEALTKGLVADAPTISGAVEKINGWYDSGHKIVILTAREEHWRDQTEEWLENIDLKHHELILDEDKGPRAVKEGIDIMIDDKPANIEDLQEHGVNAYVFDRPWNQDVDAPRIHSWAKERKGFCKQAVDYDDSKHEDPDWWKQDPETGEYPSPDKSEVKHGLLDHLTGKYLEVMSEINRAIVKREWDPKRTFKQFQSDRDVGGHFLHNFMDNHASPQYKEHWRLVEDVYRDLQDTMEWEEAIRHFDNAIQEQVMLMGEAGREEPPSADELDSWLEGKIKGFTKIAPGPFQNFRPIEMKVVRYLEQEINKLPEDERSQYQAVVNKFRDRLQPVSKEEITKFLSAVIDAQGRAAKPKFKPKAPEEFMIFPPAEGQPKEVTKEREPTEEYYGATGYIRTIQKLLEGLDTIPIAGWPQGYVAIEFGDEVLLINHLPMHKGTGKAGGGNMVFILPGEIEGTNWREYLQGYSREEIKQLIKEKAISGAAMNRNNAQVLTLLENLQAGTGHKGFTKFSAPRWTTEQKNRLKDLYIKYRERDIPHHIIYKAAAELLDKSFLAIKQKLESMYDIDEDLGGHKYQHWDKDKIDNTIQDLYRGGQPINRLGLPAVLMYQITNHSLPKADTCDFPTFYDSFDNAIASNILSIGFERDGDILTENKIDSLEDALQYYRRKEKLAHAWVKDEIVSLLRDAHIAGLPLTHSFFKSHPDIYKPLLGVGRSLEGLRDSVKRNGHTWSDLVIEAAPEYVDFYTDDGRLRSSTEEMRIRRFLELNSIPFRIAEKIDKIAVEDPELLEQGYKHFVPDFFIIDDNGDTQAIVEVFGSIADSDAANTAEIYREKMAAKHRFYETLPYQFISINNNKDGVDLTDEILESKFSAFMGV